MTYEQFRQLVEDVSNSSALAAFACKEGRYTDKARYDAQEATAKRQLLSWAASRELK